MVRHDGIWAESFYFTQKEANDRLDVLQAQCKRQLMTECGDCNGTGFALIRNDDRMVYDTTEPCYCTEGECACEYVGVHAIKITWT